MYVFKAVITALAFGAFSASAHPHGLRPRTCKHAGSASSAALVNIASASGIASASSSVVPSASAASSSGAHASTSSSVHSSSAQSSTASASSATPSSSPSGGSPLGSNKVVSDLFPLQPAQSKLWTTSKAASAPLPLSDSTFRPIKDISALSHNYVNAPDGELSMQAHFPKGSYTFGHQPQGGISFYAPGPSNVDLTTAKEATLGYSVYFPQGFQWNKGGKLPGLYGGDDDSVAVSCSGGRRDTRCFSVRLMWRENGEGEMYSYLPPGLAGNDNVCNVKPLSICNPTYGASIGRGAFSFQGGKRSYVTERVRLNDEGQANGEIELFVDGQSVISAKGLTLRDNASGRIRGIQMQTFFGGSTPDYASPVDQDIYFSDFSVAITQTL